MRLPRRHRFTRFAALGVSAAALAGLVHLESVWAHPDVEQIDPAISSQTVDDSDDTLEPEALLAVANTPGQINAALATLPAEIVAMPTTAAVQPTVEPRTPAPVTPDLVAVPDLEGLGVHKAVKALNKAGLKVRVRDEYGWRLGAYEWMYFRVKTQKVDAGTMVLPGSRIALEVEIDPAKMLAEGY